MRGCQGGLEQRSTGCAIPASMTAAASQSHFPHPSPQNTPPVRDPSATGLHCPQPLACSALCAPTRAQPAAGTPSQQRTPPPVSPHSPYLGRWPCYCRSVSPGAARCTASRRARRRRSASAPGSPARMSGSRRSTGTTPPPPGPLWETRSLRASGFPEGARKVPWSTHRGWESARAAPGMRTRCLGNRGDTEDVSGAKEPMLLSRPSTGCT